MISILHYILIVLLLVLAWQDFSQFQFHAILLVLLAICSVWVNVVQLQPVNYFQGTGVNLLLLVGELSVLYLVLKARGKELLSSFALGDVLILAVLATYFATFNFLAFAFAGILVALVSHLIIKRKGQTKIPLAGYYALLWSAYIMGNEAGLIQSAQQEWILEIVMNES